MSRRPRPAARRLARVAAGVTGATLGLAGAAVAERNAFVLRRATLPLLPPGGAPLTILHLSDLHMLPEQRRKQEFVRALAGLRPDLVVDTGDNLASATSVPAVVQALGPLLDVPGAFVFGSNDYHAPVPPNPLAYVGLAGKRRGAEPLPWRDLRAALSERGWVDATHRRVELSAGGRSVLVAGVDDPDIGADRYDEIAGPAGAGFDLRLGLTHAPEPRVLDRFDADGFDLALAGHTHGGQLRLPTGALVTNCGIDRSRARGLSAWGSQLVLHVSAGLGTSPYVPLRMLCPPEATLLTLTPRGPGGEAAAPVPEPVVEDELVPA